MSHHGFRVCFTPLFEVLFTFPSRYSSTIGLSVVFSLAGWSPLIPAGFLVSCGTQVPAGLTPMVPRTGLSPSAVPLSFGFRYHLRLGSAAGPTTPGGASPPPRFGLLRFRSPLLAESLLFSLPAGTEMFQFPAFAFLTECQAFYLTGCPIRTSLDQGLFAPPQGFSQLITSFFASESLGIHRLPFLTFFFSVDRSAFQCPYLYFLCFASRMIDLSSACSLFSICFFFVSFFEVVQYVKDLFFFVENNGFEPLTLCVQSRCSSQLS